MTDNAVRDIGYLDTLPPEWAIDLLPAIREKIEKSKAKIVILDDDPTGTQTVRDLPVLTHWSVPALRKELAGKYPAFFILTNSRSLPESGACILAHEIGVNLRQASEQAKIRTILISRSDSTLRGHFPAEVDEMARVMGKENLPYLILPFFLEGGRYTLNDIHYVREGKKLVPAALTPFARDAAFGFRHSNLRKWVEEKTRGKIVAARVTAIGLDDLRLGGPARTAEILAGVPPDGACIVNAASYRDMEVLVTALLEVENIGKEFLCRTAASFVRTRTGMSRREGLLAGEDLGRGSRQGGLYVIGSYIEKTSRQIQELIGRADMTAIEIRVRDLLDPIGNRAEITRIAAETSAALENGKDTAVYTSRELITGKDAEASLKIGQTVSDGLIEIVRRIRVQPRYLVAKGGITSSDVATKGLGVKRAMVIGQVLPGVPVWKLGNETRFPGMSYIIFPGNVGDNDALAGIQQKLRAPEHQKRIKNIS
jgi:uncharacterized protein YgbK (DUF1537 family)